MHMMTTLRKMTKQIMVISLQKFILKISFISRPKHLYIITREKSGNHES